MSLWAALAAGRDHACADTIGQRLLSETAPKDRSWPVVPCSAWIGPAPGPVAAPDLEAANQLELMLPFAGR
jgi:hypothetical protein